MMRMALKVELLDGRVQHVMVAAPDLIAFEREYDKAMTVLGTGRLEYLFFVAWRAMSRTKQTALGFDDWCDTIASIKDDETAAEELVPLESSPPTGSSPTLPTSTT